jgi:hypothetical protein
LSGGGTGSGSGGSGLVIISFDGPTPTISVGLTYSETTVGSNTVISFTGGTGTVTW